MDSKLINILIVDDDENLLRSMVRLFRTHLPAAHIETAVNGAQACAMMTICMPSVIIMDIRMPAMDGTEILRFLQNNQRYAQVKVITITGLSERDIKVSMIRGQGVTEIFYKPFPQEELVAAVKRALADSKNDYAFVEREGTHS